MAERSKGRCGWKSLFLAVLILSGCIVWSSSSSEGAVKYVTEGGNGARDGTSWGDAYGEAEFRPALDAAVSGDEFWVAAGRYRPSTTGGVLWAFIINGGVSLYGGFAGTETARDQRDWETNVSVLTGDLDFNDTADGNGITARVQDINIAGNGNSRQVVIVSGNIGHGSVLDGFAVTAGYADGGNNGGGMINEASDVEIRNCSFVGNYASGSGGGLYCSSSTSPVTECIFSGNKAGWGGGLHCEDSALSVNGCLFFENTAEFGGGMCSINTDVPDVQNCTFHKNISSDRGGGMYVSNSAAVSACTFTGNEAKDGGGMFNIGASPQVTNCTFSGNSSINWGGGMNNYWAAETKVMNCTFFGNGAAAGGNMGNMDSDPTVTNTIFWGAAAGGEIHDDATSTPVMAFCVVQGGYPGGTDIITGDPRLGSLANNGGTTLTYALLDGSSALDAGTSAGAPGVDQRGVVRPQGSGFDIGAFEVLVSPGGGSGGGGGCSSGLVHPGGWILLFLPWAFLFGKRR